MEISQETLDWLLDSDPALQWQVERDILALPEEKWMATRMRTGSEGFGSRMLALQDPDGQWAGGAFFPKVPQHSDLVGEGDNQGQPFTATTWSLKHLREWGVNPELLGKTAAQLEASCRWEYQDLPFWDGEVDCCINSYTLASGAWLKHDVSGIANWFIEHQLKDGGWNCEWVEGSTKSSFHSTLNSLIGLLEYEKLTGKDTSIRDARKRAEEYLLERKLMFKLSNGELVGEWATQFTYPPRWRYSILRALNYFRDASQFDSAPPDVRLAESASLVKSLANERGRWVNQFSEKGEVWFDTEVSEGEESKWVTFSAIRAVSWLDN